MTYTGCEFRGRDALQTPLKRLLAEATESIVRLTPSEAREAATGSATLIDIRDQEARRRGGVIPGALHIPRTVLEWRVAPDSSWRSPHLRGADQELVLICDHGYSSVLAAATLVQLGIDAGDVVGGFDAWVKAGLPLRSMATRRSFDDELPGMGPPD